MGFDGFTDEILSCVKTRSDATSFEPFKTISDFATNIKEAENKSTNFELVVKQKKIGGNGPILANALASAGFAPTLIGALGIPEIEPIFYPLVEKCKKVLSIAPSGHTDAIEFADGKIMFGKHQSILEIDETLLRKHIHAATLRTIFDETDIFASVNWTMLLGMTQIWKYLAEHILPKISKKTRHLFIDLADPAKRSEEDLKEAIATLKILQNYYTTTLGLNESEALRIARLYDSQWMAPKSKEQLITTCKLIEFNTGFDQIVIHTTKQAAATSNEDHAVVDGPFCKNPFLTTGGGDNFNAGFLVGQALELSLQESLLLGVATSGFYVRTGNSPTLQELVSFLRAWDRGLLDLDPGMSFTS